MTNSAKPDGLMICITGPSGTGKSSICHGLLAHDDHLAFSISTTSRAPRPGDVDGQHYHFVSREVFKSLIAQGRFYEYAEVYGNLYGTQRQVVDELLGQGRDVLLDIDVQGSLNVQKLRPDAVLIFIKPPSLDALRKRLEGRQQDAAEVIERRLRFAEEEIAQADKFGHLVVNEQLAQTIAQVRAIIEQERAR